MLQSVLSSAGWQHVVKRCTCSLRCSWSKTEAAVEAVIAAYLLWSSPCNTASRPSAGPTPTRIRIELLIPAARERRCRSLGGGAQQLPDGQTVQASLTRHLPCRMAQVPQGDWYCPRCSERAVVPGIPQPGALHWRTPGAHDYIRLAHMLGAVSSGP